MGLCACHPASVCEETATKFTGAAGDTKPGTSYDRNAAVSAPNPKRTFLWMSESSPLVQTPRGTMSHQSTRPGNPSSLSCSPHPSPCAVNVHCQLSWTHQWERSVCLSIYSYPIPDVPALLSPASLLYHQWSHVTPWVFPLESEE